MALLIKEVCGVLIATPEGLALVLFLLFCTIGGVYMAGVKGRRRLYDKKADKEQVEGLKTDIARVETRIYELALAMGKKQNPLHPDTVRLANGNK